MDETGVVGADGGGTVKFGWPHYAVDGIDGMDFNRDRCAQTKKQAYPFIRIDFGEEVPVGLVELYPRLDKLQTMEKYELRVAFHWIFL